MYGRTEQINQNLLQTDQENISRRNSIGQNLKIQWRSKKKFLFFKISAVIIGLALAALNSSFNLINHTSTVACFVDIVQNWTVNITIYFEDHTSARDALIIISSLMIDINILLIGTRWILYGNSLRVFIILVTFYVSRGLIQRTFYMCFPEHFIFEYPGFPSVGVPYAKANDFFWSGHIGILTIILNEYIKDKVTPLIWFGFISVIYNFFALLITRAHYFIDLCVGIVVANYIFQLGLWSSRKLEETSPPLFQSSLHSNMKNNDKNLYISDSQGSEKSVEKERVNLS